MDASFTGLIGTVSRGVWGSILSSMKRMDAKLTGFFLSLLMAGPMSAGAVEAPEGLDQAALSGASRKAIDDGVRNLWGRVEREKLRLKDDELAAWHRLIAEAGSRGAFFNPNLDVVKLAKGISFGEEPEVQVFSAFPNGRGGKVDTLIYATSCDFIARQSTTRFPCRGAEQEAFLASDDGVPFAAYASGGKVIDINDPKVLERFVALRARLLKR